MINIRFPDGAQREYAPGTTSLDIAKSISEGLARKILAASVNGQVWDLNRPVYEDATIKFLGWEEKRQKVPFGILRLT